MLDALKTTGTVNESWCRKVEKTHPRYPRGYLGQVSTLTSLQSKTNYSMLPVLVASNEPQ